MSLTNNNQPSVAGLGGEDNIPTSNNVVVSYKLKAASSVAKGDFLKLTSTATGLVEKTTATGDTVIGVANVSVDNSLGGDGDKFVPVLKQGFAELDAVVTASGNYSAAIGSDSSLYLTGSATAAGQAGQVLTATTTTGIGTKKIGRSLDAVAVPATSGLYKIRVYIDTLNNSIT